MSVGHFRIEGKTYVESETDRADRRVFEKDI